LPTFYRVFPLAVASTTPVTITNRNHLSFSLLPRIIATPNSNHYYGKCDADEELANEEEKQKGDLFSSVTATPGFFTKTLSRFELPLPSLYGSMWGRGSSGTPADCVTHSCQHPLNPRGWTPLLPTTTIVLPVVWPPCRLFIFCSTPRGNEFFVSTFSPTPNKGPIEKGVHPNTFNAPFLKVSRPTMDTYYSISPISQFRHFASPATPSHTSFHLYHILLM